jgi:hypothetical protein
VLIRRAGARYCPGRQCLCPPMPVLREPPGRRLGPLCLDSSVSGDTLLPCTGSQASVTLDR